MPIFWPLYIDSLTIPFQCLSRDVRKHIQAEHWAQPRKKKMREARPRPSSELNNPKTPFIFPPPGPNLKSPKCISRSRSLT